MKKRMVKVPPENDPSWIALSAPLLRFIDEGPKTWPMLNAWARSSRYTGDRLRQAIAWAEGRNLIHYRDGSWSRLRSSGG